MAVQSLIEGKLCKLWARAETTGEWWDMFTELADIADVMLAAGHDESAHMFADAAELALNRRIIAMREAA